MTNPNDRFNIDIDLYWAGLILLLEPAVKELSIESNDAVKDINLAKNTLITEKPYLYDKILTATNPPTFNYSSLGELGAECAHMADKLINDFNLSSKENDSLEKAMALLGQAIIKSLESFDTENE